MPVNSGSVLKIIGELMLTGQTIIASAVLRART